VESAPLRKPGKEKFNRKYILATFMYILSIKNIMKGVQLSSRESEGVCISAPLWASMVGQERIERYAVFALV
jgi:hypothetical protein